MRDKINFLIQGVKNFKEVGTITRSGPTLCKKMIASVPADQDMVIVELGAGDGVITHHLLKKLTPGSKVISIELNPKLWEQLNSIDDPKLIAINDTMENLKPILEEQGIDQIDQIISAIPFALFPKEEVKGFLDNHKSLIKPGGKYIQLHYGPNLFNFYKDIFGIGKLHFVLSNVPPAFVMEFDA